MGTRRDTDSGVRWPARALDRVVGLFDLGLGPQDVAPEVLRRIRILSIVTFAMVGVAMLWCIRHWQLGIPEMSFAVLGTSVAAVANLALLRVTRRPAVAAHLALGLLVLQLCFSSAFAGGFYDPNFAWLYLVPISAAVVLDLRGAAIWTGVTAVVTLAFWLLPEAGFVLETRIPEAEREGVALFTRLTAILAMGLLGAAFVTGQRRAERGLGVANADLQREAAYVQLLMHAAVAANESASLEKAMEATVVRICQNMGWEVGHVWVQTEEGALVSSGFHHVPDRSRFAPLIEYTVSGIYWPGEGLPGRAVSTGRPQCIADLAATEGLGERADIARAAGLRSAFSVPIPVHGEVRAVLEFAASEVAPAVDRLVDVFSHIGTQLGRVAERTRLQERLRQSQKLEAVGQLAAGLAHEINNPMSYVRSNLHILRQEWDALRSKISAVDVLATAGGSLEDFQELIDESLEGVDRTIAIVKDVREFSHFGGGAASAGEEIADLPDLVEGAVRVASARANPDIVFEREFGACRPVAGNPNQLRQVLVNLIVNAVQAVGDDGHIRLVTGSDGGDSWVRIEDDGPGMTEETRERLFDPFFTTKPVGEGTGLGLYVSYEIVQNHGGHIAVQSEPGVGTCFEVRLPVHEERT